MFLNIEKKVQENVAMMFSCELQKWVVDLKTSCHFPSV